ncbi:MAG: response regulator [Bacillota bacterium]|nr:response regulator [Bacillota bacterium]
MKKLLIVDDDALIRAALHTIVDWNELGYEIAGDAQNGEQALQILKKEQIELVFTDMKMPIMDGIRLMEQINQMDKKPQIVALSGYDDFSLVRSAFKMGAFDYVLKEDISVQGITELIKKINPIIKEDREPFCSEKKEEEDFLKEMILGRTVPVKKGRIFEGSYVLAAFEIDEFKENTVRFQSSFEEYLVKPMINIAQQIPRIANKCIFISLSPGLYFLYIPVSEGELEIASEAVISLCKQLKNVWNNYMNLPVSVGISRVGRTPEEFCTCLLDTENQLKLRYLVGKGSINFYGQKGKIIPEKAYEKQIIYADIIQTLQEGDLVKLEEQKRILLRRLTDMKEEDARKECLYLVWFIALMMRENEDNIWSLFLGEVDYYEKIGRIADGGSLAIWTNNYISYVADYIVNTYDRNQMDLFQKARRFIMDNYTNPELTLGSVAAYVGLNEKYFSSCFTKEIGNTFSNFLTEIRMENARELLRTTDMKMYEISEKVGYNNVEHFNRMFKKVCGVSPSVYKRQSL